MSICEKHSVTRWGMTGLAGLMALTLVACGKIPQDGTSNNQAGKNFYILALGPYSYYTAGGTLTDNQCKDGELVAWTYASTYLSTAGNISSLVVVRNDNISKDLPTTSDNIVIHMSNIHVEYDVPGATAQIPSYDHAIGESVRPMGSSSGASSMWCTGGVIFPQGAKDFINQNRSKFPGNATTNNYFQVRAKVQVQGYETNGGTSVMTPSAYFTIHVY